MVLCYGRFIPKASTQIHIVLYVGGKVYCVCVPAVTVMLFNRIFPFSLKSSAGSGSVSMSLWAPGAGGRRPPPQPNPNSGYARLIRERNVLNI